MGKHTEESFRKKFERKSVEFDKLFPNARNDIKKLKSITKRLESIAAKFLNLNFAVIRPRKYPTAVAIIRGNKGISKNPTI